MEDRTSLPLAAAAVLVLMLGSSITAATLITESAPLNDGIGWTGAFLNWGTNNLTGYIWAVCADVR